MSGKVVVEFTIRETVRSTRRVEVDPEEFLRVTGRTFGEFTADVDAYFEEEACESSLRAYIDATGAQVSVSNEERGGDDDEWVDFEIKEEGP